ncbi:RDD family protein [Rhodanobacter sp. AS-Z3]|uniref:RDD family protein n=1 Tax=Rhodanobacter sp. AS-Z3 TaxID=3031330 RepID=UPI002478E8FC|nr:RDD family protein [Rhodanobacter sp. AS-Z3]WEN16181.1 RDD family protein [Rhodanobacter sp. AS-Z3]
MPADSTVLHAPCQLWRRLLALVYDVLIVVAIVMVVGLLCQLATAGNLITTGAKTAVPLWYQLLQGVVVAAYFISSWRRGGQTIGMRPWRIRLTGDDGSAVTLQQSLIRLLVAGAPMVLLLLTPTLGLRLTLWTLLAVWTAWFAVALFDPRRRAVHDFATGTEVRRLD